MWLVFLLLLPPTRYPDFFGHVCFIVELEFIKLNRTQIKGLILLEMGILNPEFRFLFIAFSLPVS